MRKLRHLVLPVLTGISGGLLSSQAFPDSNIWFAIFPALALILFGVTAVSPRASLLVGFLAGLTWYASQIPWMTAYLGPVPWLALSTLEALIFAVGGYCLNLAHLFFKRHEHTMWSTTVLALAVASIWSAREWLAYHIPYGGFPWSSVAMSQSASPFAGIAYWGGQTAITFALVFLTALLLFGWRELNPRQWHGSLTAVLVAAVVLFPALTPLEIEADAGALKIAAVQGNANAGLFANEEPGSILKNHLDASAELITDKVRPAVIIWPENAADLNPLGNADSAWAITRFVDQSKVPLIFGTITSRGNKFFNSSILWQPRIGATDFYDKKRPVPFAEYVPDRAFWRMLAPDLIDMVSWGYEFGKRDGIFEVNGHKLGVMICFEVAIDEIPRDLVRSGAQLLVVQTNNSDFGKTNESTQQLALAKLQAIATGRAVVNISTVGTSALIYPNGAVSAQLPAFEAGTLRGELPLRTQVTPATLYADSLNLVINSSALAQVLFLVWLRINKRRQQAHV
jgi:apolipoprotein N-acyltransferase